MESKQYITFMIMVAAIFSGMPAMAGLSFYTDRSAWESDVNGDIVPENFDLVTPYFLSEGVNTAGLLDIEMVNLAEENQWNSVDNGSGLWNINGTHFLQGACYPPYPDNAMIIHLPFSSSAFGGDFRSTNSSSGLMLEVNGLTYEFSDWVPAGDETGFFGFTSTIAFSSVTLFTIYNLPHYGESFGLDNVSFVEVPEPTIMVLLGLGGLILRKSKK